jgi:membrane fusion protein, multidrug efflux system
MRRFVVLAVILIGAAAILGWYLSRSGSQGGAAGGAEADTVPVTASQATAQNVPDYIQTVGTVTSIDAVSIQPRVIGQITQILFKPGEEVKKDQPLFVIDPRPYQAALDQAEAQLAHDQAVLKEAQTDLTRYQNLVKTKAIPEQQEQDQVYVVEQDEGTVRVDQANVETARLNLEYCHIASPIDGRAGTLLIDLGNYVQSTTSSLVSITQMKPIYVNFPIPQTQLDEVRENQAKSPLNVEARSQSGKTLGQGKLTIIDNQVNTATGTATMQATFPNDDEALWPGTFVVVRLEVFVRENAITVPAETVMEGPSGSFVFIIKPDNTVQHVDVHVAARQNGVAVIDKGLSAGEMVVTTGQYRLANNVRVRVEGATKPG